MKKIILVFAAFVFLFSCNDSETDNENSASETSTQETTDANPTPEDYDSSGDASTVILGTWTGELNEEKITIVIQEINGKELAGYKMVGSGKRDLTGTFADGAYDQPCSRAFMASLNEPGDEEGDGSLLINFVGFEDEKETEEGPACIGNLKGMKAQGTWISKDGTTITDILFLKQNKPNTIQ